MDAIWQTTFSNAFSWMEIYEWMSEWLSLTAFMGTVDIRVHLVHTGRVIIAYTLESLSPLTYITHNLQATIKLNKMYKKETQKSEGTH